jgi:hypothetical protein
MDYIFTIEIIVGFCLNSALNNVYMYIVYMQFRKLKHVQSHPSEY